MNQILGDAAADAAEHFIIDPERMAAASRAAGPEGMPTYQAFKDA